MLAEVFWICHKGKTKANQKEMFVARVALVEIADRIPKTYNTNDG